MPYSGATQPVTDSIQKVNNEIAVGSDLDFQWRWWRFERVIWFLFTVIVILDALGVFGRGYLAKAEMRAPDGAMEVKYERVERYGTPSVMNVQFGPNAIRDGKVQFWVSESLVRDLGAQRVIPQPLTSVVGEGGILYTFPATATPLTVQFALQPSKVGHHELTLRVPSLSELKMGVFVMP